MISALILLLGAAAAAPTPPAPSAAAHWEGSITLPAGDLPVVVDLDREGVEHWKGEADVPPQGIRNLGVVNLTVSGTSVRFELPGIPGTPTFQGTLSEDGTSLSGSFLQAGQTLPFQLQRKGDPVFGAVPDDGIRLVEKGVAGQGVAGEWHAVLEAGPHKLRTILQVSQTQEGGLSGNMESVDQGRSKFDLENLTSTEGAFSFDIGKIGGSFDGKLSPDGSEISGQWTQRGASIPLTFKRAK